MNEIGSIEYINEKMTEVIEKIETTPATAIRQKDRAVKNFGGFNFFEAIEHEKIVNKEVEKFKEECIGLESELLTYGIKAKAFLSVKTWNRLCNEAGLYRLHPSKGRVNLLRKNIFDNYTNFSWILRFPITAGLLIIEYGIIKTAVTLLNRYPVGVGPLLYFGAFILTIVGLFGAIPTIISIFTDIFDDSYSRLIRSIVIRILNKKKFLELAFPNKVAYGDEEGPFQGPMLDLPLPEKNEDRELIKKVDANFNISIACEVEAIDFVGGWKNILHKENARITAEEIEARHIKNLLDPIIYVERYNVVAVILQFGKFNIEKTVIDKILSDPDII